MKKILSFTLIAVLLVSCFTFAAGALNKVDIRIEGKENTYFNGSVYIGENAKVIDVIKAVDEANDSIDVTITESSYGDYISGINGDNEATEVVPDPEDNEKGTTYYIGWMFAVNNMGASVGASAYELSGGESIVFYYADMNCQVPVADFSEENIIKLTSYDYDWMSDNSTWNPVSGVNVTLNNKKYVSDENGVVTYDPEDFKSLVNVQIERYDELGYPTVCRFADNFVFRPSVPEQPKPVTLNCKESLYVKEQYQIDLSTDEAVTYTSSNSKTATVSSSGKITAKKAGTATITAKAGSITANYKITVNNPTINCKTKTLKKGKSFTLKVTGASSVTFSSNKKSVALVNSKGKVTAKKKGKAVITVKANGVTLKCNVTVK